MCKFSHLLSGLLQLPLRPHSFQPLQLIQNAAARLVFNLPRPSHVIPLMQSLHWLLVSNTKSCCWQTKRDPHMYATRPLSRSTHTGLLSCFFGGFFCHHCPFSLPLRFFPSLAVVPVSSLLLLPSTPIPQFLHKNPIYVYFITIIILGSW